MNMASQPFLNKQGTVIGDDTIAQLKAVFRGSLITPGDARYDKARQVYNGMIDKRPGLIAQCADAADVMQSVNFGREQDLDIAVRGGGHHGAGLSTCADGLVIDLSLMRGVRVDPKAQTAEVQGGCILGDVDHATHAFGLAAPFGIMSTTGVGGLTLGGGLGYITRKCGLSIDNLLAADVVLADGSFVTASADEYEDLFWALRGGGSNFGVVTSFRFNLHPIQTVYAGPMLWHLDQIREILQWYREFIVQAPDELNGFFAFLIVPPSPHFPEHLHYKTMGGIVWCHAGSTNRAEEAFQPIRKQFPPALDLVGPLPYPALQSMFDPLYPPGMQWYWKADFVDELSDEAIAVHLKYGTQLPTMLSTMHLYPIDGAAGRIGKNDTAFSYRKSKWCNVIAGIDPDPANAGKITAWASEYWSALHPYSAGGGYVNMNMEEGQERVKAAYRDNYPRLAEIKRKYDPANLFHFNQNIQPQN
jgi:FAD/FMN-containing dehydrogenase